MTTPPTPAWRPARGAARLLRGAVVALTGVLPALAGHLAGGGAVPPAALAPVLLAALALCTWCSDRRWTLRALLAVLLLTQASVHLVLMTACAHSGGSHIGTGMVLGHLLAVASSAVLLRRADAWCWALADALGLRVQRWARVTAPAVRPLRMPVMPRSVRLVGRCVVDPLSRRGPPRVLAASP